MFVNFAAIDEELREGSEHALILSKPDRKSVSFVHSHIEAHDCSADAEKSDFIHKKCLVLE